MTTGRWVAVGLAVLALGAVMVVVTAALWLNVETKSPPATVSTFKQVPCSVGDPNWVANGCPGEPK